MERLIRVLGASVNVAAMRELVADRRARPDDGWIMLSELAARLGEAPGTVSVAVQKLIPLLVEEKYEKGRRYFRAIVTGISLVLDEVGR